MSWGIGRCIRPRSGIYLVNQAPVLKGESLASIAAACALQLQRDVAPAYAQRPVRVQALSKVEHAPRDSSVIVVLDDREHSLEEAYPAVDRLERRISRVFAASARIAGITLSSLISHQVVEAFVDPYASTWKETWSGEVAYEAVDPVEDGTYLTRGHMVSNFVYPAWFNEDARFGPFDHLGVVKQPLTISEGGSVLVRNDGELLQRVGCCHDKARKAMRFTVLARTARRGLLRV